MAAAKSRDEPPRSRAQDIDRHVGARMRQRRIMLGLTQQQLADLIGVTYQQAHKYEKGINRIAAGRLSGIAQALGVEIGYFYEGMSQTPAAGAAGPGRPRGGARLSRGRTCRRAGSRRGFHLTPRTARSPARAVTRGSSWRR